MIFNKYRTYEIVNIKIYYFVKTLCSYINLHIVLILYANFPIYPTNPVS